MDHERFKCILSLLEQYDLTLREKQFIEVVEKYFRENRKVTDQQESILQGIYKEKIWARKAYFSESNVLKNSSSRGA
jgi:uncharacterized membrane-anchored protein